MVDRVIGQLFAKHVDFSASAINRDIAGLAIGDGQDFGHYNLSGSLAIDASPDVPVARRVWLFDVITMRVVRTTMSDSVTGTWRFESIRRGPWLVLSVDTAGVYNAVVCSHLSDPSRWLYADPMPGHTS